VGAGPAREVRRMGIAQAGMGSPLGELTLVGSDGALAGLYFAGQRNRPRPARLGCLAPAEFAEPMRQLGEYFAGERTAFELDLELHGDAFDRRVGGAAGARPRAAGPALQPPEPGP